MTASPAHSMKSGRLARLWRYLLALVLLAAGLFLAIGGARLVARGSSGYFLVAGVSSRTRCRV